MSIHIPGGSVTFHPGPKIATDGTKLQHGSHDVKMGHGGNDVIINASPLDKSLKLGQHNTIVQEHPGNIVMMHLLAETETLDNSYADLLANVSSHSREGLEELASSLDVPFIPEIKDGDLANLITEAIFQLEKETNNGGK